VISLSGSFFSVVMNHTCVSFTSSSCITSCMFVCHRMPFSVLQERHTLLLVYHQRIKICFASSHRLAAGSPSHFRLQASIE
jgi:hypothetical protein